MLTIDFETEAIVANPTVRPPRPVGCAFKHTGFKSWYTTDMFKARATILAARAAGEPVLFYNAKFDLAVARRWLEIEFPPEQVHDALFMVYLEDPYAETFSLKPSAERILNWPAKEEADLKAWILGHTPARESDWGSYICRAPKKLVAPYARGDVERTHALYTTLQNRVPEAAYNRERQLLPIIMEGEANGIRVDAELLDSDLAAYEEALEQVSARIRRLLDTPECNLDSGQELADAIDSAGFAGQ